MLQGQQALPKCKPTSVGCPGDVKYMPPSHDLNTPTKLWSPACPYGIIFKTIVSVELEGLIEMTTKHLEQFMRALCPHANITGTNQTASGILMGPLLLLRSEGSL